MNLPRPILLASIAAAVTLRAYGEQADVMAEVATVMEAPERSGDQKLPAAGRAPVRRRVIGSEYMG